MRGEATQGVYQQLKNSRGLIRPGVGDGARASHAAHVMQVSPRGATVPWCSSERLCTVSYGPKSQAHLFFSFHLSPLRRVSPSRPPHALIPQRLKRVLCVLGHGEALWTEIAGQNGVLMVTNTFISVLRR